MSQPIQAPQPPIQRSIIETAQQEQDQLLNSQEIIPRPQVSVENEHNQKILELLNKVTIGTINSLAEELFSHIISERVLDNLIDIIFEKAMYEKKYHVIYAELCFHIATIEGNKGFLFAPKTQPIPQAKDAVLQSTFRKKILNRCQDYFERNKKFIISDEDKLKLRQTEIEEQEELFRVRKKGNIIFVGMLLNNGLINMNVSAAIIKMLIEGSNPESPDQDNMESLAIFLDAIGFNLNREQPKYLSSIINRINAIIQGGKLISTTKSSLMHVCDLYKEKGFTDHRRETQTVIPDLSGQQIISSVNPPLPPNQGWQQFNIVRKQ
ncbi:MAG: hypothetical protein EZS28_040801 [Streblomastix strix]|uniref:MIF4G domain-containing protein n=1 Tax=Streblomastix strix TaxID=222440 RepID=A0A5J4U101_9EUKA|nr:MAG: hypothetical protein EZS28_040801 [Streblomastix strix]